MVGYVWRGYITTNYRRCSGETTGNESNAINASWLTGPDLHHLSQIEMRAPQLLGEIVFGSILLYFFIYFFLLKKKKLSNDTRKYAVTWDD